MNRWQVDVSASIAVIDRWLGVGTMWLGMGSADARTGADSSEMLDRDGAPCVY